MKQRAAELVEEDREVDSKVDVLGQMLRRLTGETNQRIGDLRREHDSQEADLRKVLAVESLHHPGPLGHLVTWFESQPLSNRASLDSAVREISTGIPTVAGLASSKRLREIELQFDVEAMGRSASGEG